MADRTLTRPILDLATFAAGPKPVIAIDGMPYTLRRPSDLTARQMLQIEDDLRVLGPITAALTANVDATVDEAEMERRLARICRNVLETGPEVLDRLSALHRMQIVQVFIELPQSSATQTAGAMRGAPATKPRRGTRSFRGSNGSLGATRSRGSSGTRSR